MAQLATEFVPEPQQRRRLLALDNAIFAALALA
jgi:hypothetical protein